MKIEIEYIGIGKNTKAGRLIKKTLRKAVQMYGNKVKLSVNVQMCTDEYIKKINGEYRKIDKATDVLSFPLINWQNPCDWSSLKLGEDIDPETGCAELGDIIISEQTAKRQAEEFNHSTEREIAYLALHGFLHLLGYDHMNEDDKKLMREKEENVLNALNIVR